MIDFVIRGGQVVTPWGVGDWDVAIEGEKIAAVASRGSLSGEVGRVIDAAGKIVVPGGIEPHAHVAAPIAGHPGKTTAPPEQVSRAALFGGTTTITDFAIQHPGTDIPQAIEERTSAWRGHSYGDYSHHIMMLGETPSGVMAQMREAIQEGFPTFKIFTTNVRPPSIVGRDRRLMGMGHLSGVMEQAAAHGGLMFVHAEDDDIVQYMYQKLLEEERTEATNMPLVHNNMSEDLSFRRVVRLAEWTGAAVYFVHVSAKEGLNTVREARGRGLPIYAETLHNYCSFNAEDYKKPDGMKYHTYPSLKSEEDRLSLWDGLLKGGINSMATDEYCTDFAMKMTGGNDLLQITGGHNGAETRVGVTYSEGVAKLGMSLQRFVEVTSASAARIMGYYPRKGAIAPGSDADIVLIDPTIRKTLSMADLHIGDYSIWDGWPINGWPTTTILRGKVVVENGQFHGELGRGQLIPRKIDQDILNRPAC